MNDEIYKFGQLRKQEGSNIYLTPINYNLKDYVFQADMTAIKFKDKILLSNFNGIDGEGKQQSYFIRLEIDKMIGDNQSIDLVLVNYDYNTNEIELESNTQTIENVYISSEGNGTSIIFDIIISPNANYNALWLKLIRNSNDYKVEHEDGTAGRVINCKILKLSKVKNIIDNIPGVTKFKQIGVQAAPGTILCINGEQIRVGRSGIYEIKNGILIDFLGFIIDDEDRDPFILDYQY